MPSGYAAPGCVLPICGFGHHQVDANPPDAGRSVTSVPMNGSAAVVIARAWHTATSSRGRTATPVGWLDAVAPRSYDHGVQRHPDAALPGGTLERGVEAGGVA